MKDTKDTRVTKHHAETPDLFEKLVALAIPEKGEKYLTGQQRANIQNTARWEAGMDFRLEGTNRNPYPHEGLAWNTYDEEFRLLLEEREK